LNQRFPGNAMHYYVLNPDGEGNWIDKIGHLRILLWFGGNFYQVIK